MQYPQKWVWTVPAVLLGTSALGGCGWSAVTNNGATAVHTPTVEIVEIIQERTVEVTRVVTETVVVVVTPTPALQPPKDLVVCLITEPESLYPYAAASSPAAAAAATAVRHAIFGSLYTHLAYDYQPTAALTRLPNLADGDAVLNEVTVEAGTAVVEATGNVAILQPGLSVVNAAGETVLFTGTAISMTQLTATFQLNPMVYADGVPATADDSVYSFELNADPDTPADKFKVERTASYRALDDLTIEWVGLPGFRDPTYFTNVWLPLPRHSWGPLTAAELQTADVSSRAPLGHGPFVVASWLPGDRIELVKNDYYYQPGYPRLDSLTFRFVPNANQLMAKLLSGQCDIGTQLDLDMEQAPILLEAEASGIVTPYFQISHSYEHIDFNIDPLDGRTRWFADSRVRQAIALCTDRQAMVDMLLYGRSELLHSYIPSRHPLYAAAGITEWPYDPEAGNALLTAAGYRLDEDGLRRHPETGAPFRVNLGTNSGNELRNQIGRLFQQNLRDCGIEVTLYYQPTGQWFANGPEGDLFGRRYDLAIFAWLTGAQPACHLYAADNIPGPPEALDEAGSPLHPTGWNGDNNTGWRHADFTAACRAGQQALPGTPAYTENHQAALRIFAQELPVIPLFMRLKLAAARPDLLHFKLDPTEASELYNLWELDFVR